MWTEFLEPQEERIHTTRDACFGVSLLLYLKALMCLEGTQAGIWRVSGSSPNCRPKNWEVGR